MRILKLIGALIALAAVILFVVANYSVTEVRYQCSGSLTFSGTTQPVVLYLKRERYRWWVGAWSDSDGTFWIEIPNEWVEHFPDIRESGDQIQIFDSNRALKGNFSTLSNSLALEIRTRQMFEGTCSRVSQ